MKDAMKDAMNRRGFLKAGTAAAAAAVLCRARPAPAGEADAAPAGNPAGRPAGPVAALPKPDLEGGRPLMACLAQRRSTKQFSAEDVDLATLGGLLWAVWGVNREDGRRVAPTLKNRQEIKVFAVRGDGVWEYLHESHAMGRVLEGDRRGLFKNAGLVLLYAAPKDDPFAPMHVGALYQNAGLYCAAFGLANCVKHKQRQALDAELPLPGSWMTHVAQYVSRPV